MNNKLQIIETPDYILAVSDKEIKEGEYYVTDTKEIFKCDFDSIGLANYAYDKIIAYQPKGNATELDLLLLPSFTHANCCITKDGGLTNMNKGCAERNRCLEIVIEDDVEKLASFYYGENRSTREFEEGFRKGFKIGYKAATKTFSEEDLRKAFLEGNKYPQESKYLPDFYLGNYFEKFLQSLKQPTPKWFVAEMEEESGFTPNGYYSKIVLKTTTINDKTYLVGHYE
jgi:hypothetical protein